MIKRFFFYVKKHGFISLFLLAVKKIWRSAVNNKVIIYYYDLKKDVKHKGNNGFTVEPYKIFDAIPESSLEVIYKVKGSPSVVVEFFNRFFNFKAVLWIAKYNNELVGYHWSLEKGFNGFYNIPMTENDIVLAASEIFPEYRGKGFNNMMIAAIVNHHAVDGAKRFFIGTAAWNKSQIKSLSKTFFKIYGTVRKVEVFGNYVTIWNKQDIQRNVRDEK